MQTKEQVTAAFKADLLALLNKYSADLEAKDIWNVYAERGKAIHMMVTVPATYDADNNCMREWTEIDLGNYWMPTPNYRGDNE